MLRLSRRSNRVFWNLLRGSKSICSEKRLKRGKRGQTSLLRLSESTEWELDEAFLLPHHPEAITTRGKKEGPSSQHAWQGGSETTRRELCGTDSFIPAKWRNGEEEPTKKKTESEGSLSPPSLPRGDLFISRLSGHDIIDIGSRLWRRRRRRRNERVSE